MSSTRYATAGPGGFTFQQPPQGVGSNIAGTYRDPKNASGGSRRLGNMMYDRRVVRGSTYSAQVLSLSAQVELSRIERENETRRKIQLKKKAQASRARRLLEEAKRSSTPEPVEGRKHGMVQTHQYLEELKDMPEEVQQEMQTDPLMDRPPTPLYVPFKTGRDADTQVLEGELFNFDTEVDPILDVLVGKTLEQAMLEVQQEEELEALRVQQSQFEQRRKEELLETQRIEAQERRKYEEKERRKKQEVARIQREKDIQEKLKSRMYSKSFLCNLEHRVFAKLQDEGWFRNNQEREVELHFMPWLLTRMEAELEKHRQALNLTDTLIRESVCKPKAEE